MTTLAVTSVSSLRCQACTCFRMGSKLRCIRSTPTEMESISENDFECLARTGVNAPETMFLILPVQSTWTLLFRHEPVETDRITPDCRQSALGAISSNGTLGRTSTLMRENGE